MHRTNSMAADLAIIGFATCQTPIFKGLPAGHVLTPCLRCSVANSAAQERGDVAGTLCYRHDLDGTPFSAVNHEVRADRPE